MTNRDQEDDSKGGVDVKIVTLGNRTVVESNDIDRLEYFLVGYARKLYIKYFLKNNLYCFQHNINIYDTRGNIPYL